jgi:hypothetical protein
MLPGLKEVVCLDNNNDQLFYKNWIITPLLAKTLDDSIQQQVGIEVPYNILGNTSYSASNEGHNCFTWARDTLHQLNDPNIKVEERWTDYFVANPALYLPKEGTSAKCSFM